MNTKDRNEAKRILYEIDALSESGTTMKGILECFMKNGGKAKLYVYTDGKQTVTELNDEMADVIIRDIINKYNDEITVRKSMLESVLGNAIVQLK